MENQITCPKCGKVITNKPVVESAVNKENLGSTFVVCDCGEKITFWAISAQLREQKTLGYKIKKWLRSLSKNRE
jgi:RNase P subunit RPR2